MAFPYAYYKAYYDGPIHGVSFKGKKLVLTPQAGSSGVLDVTEMGNIEIDTSLGDVIIEGFENGEEGQILFIHNISNTNKIILKNEFAAPQGIISPVSGDLSIEGHGGLILTCSLIGGDLKWIVFGNPGSSFSAGSATLPGLSVAGDRNTGFFQASSDELGISTNGIAKLLCETSSINSLVNHKFSDGTVAQPSLTFSSETNTGIFKKSFSVMAFTVGGVEQGSFTAGSFDLESGILRTDNAYLGIKDKANAPKVVMSGGLGVSNDFTTAEPQVPVNGIYASGDIKTDSYFQGTATSALYADLAERYHSDTVAEPGDVMVLGGAREVTKAEHYSAEEILGVVSTDPAFKMNAQAGDDKEWPYVALMGRVPCKVKGVVRKGERLVISKDVPGIAEAYGGPLSELSPFEVIGRALSTKTTEEIGLVEIVVGRL